MMKGEKEMNPVIIVCDVICIICSVCIIVSCITTSRYIDSMDKEVRSLAAGKERNDNENKAKEKNEIEK